MLTPNDHHCVQVTVLKSVGAGKIQVPKGQVPQHDAGCCVCLCHGGMGRTLHRMILDLDSFSMF